jgi:outer membrane protein assembly factor BamE (lipoprotein component of BamABCDE complex)
MNKKNNTKLTDLAAALKKNLNRRKNKSKKITKLNKSVVLSLFAALFLTCCKNNIRSHGPMLGQYDLAELKPHKTTVEDVIEKIGVPTVTEGNKFVYLNSKFKNVIFFEPKIIKLDYLILTFDNNNTLVNLNHQELSNVDGLNYDDTKIQFAVDKSSIWDQITRNLGKFSTNAQRGAR